MQGATVALKKGSLYPRHSDPDLHRAIGKSNRKTKTQAGRGIAINIL